MPESTILTPKLIQQFVEEELSLRSSSFGLETAQAVLRYGAVVGSVLEQHGRISRGSDWARQLIGKAEEIGTSFHSGTVILAEEMMHSKGRFKRTWHAPRGGLWMTLVLVNTLLPESSLLLPMAAGLANCEVLRHYGIEAHIKWVNDTLVNKRKISGTLIETFTGRRFGEEYILIGIGINVNNVQFPPELSDTATSMKSCLEGELNLTEVAARLLVKLRWNIGLLFYEEIKNLETHGGVANRNETCTENFSQNDHPILKSYQNLTDIYGRRVLFGFDVQQKPQFEARVRGLDGTGGLILELDDGSTVIEHSGEILYLD